MTRKGWRTGSLKMSRKWNLGGGGSADPESIAARASRLLPWRLRISWSWFPGYARLLPWFLGYCHELKAIFCDFQVIASAPRLLPWRFRISWNWFSRDMVSDNGATSNFHPTMWQKSDGSQDRGSQRQNRRLCLLAMFAAGYISHKVSLYLTAANLQFSISVLILYKSREGGQVVLMWLFARLVLFILWIYSSFWKQQCVIIWCLLHKP